MYTKIVAAMHSVLAQQSEASGFSCGMQLYVC